MLLDGFEGGDETGRVVGPVEIPSVESGEVLQSTEKLFPAD